MIVTLCFRPELLTASYMIGLWIGLAFLAVVNIVDELGRLVHPKYRLSPKLKFLVQAGVACIALVLSNVGRSQITLQGTTYFF